MPKRFALIFVLCSSLLFSQEERIYGVMITGKDAARAPLALLSIRSFLCQTYPNKHLLIVNDGEQLFDMFDPEFVTEIKVHPKRVLGALRNIALEALDENTLWVQWDDDDWHHPNAVEEQYRFLLENGADLCCMGAQVQYAFKIDAAWEVYRKIEGTILARKKGDVSYAEIAKGEDTEFLKRFQEKYRVVVWHNPPRYYLRFIHGNNTWSERYFGLNWRKKHSWEIGSLERAYLKEVLGIYKAAL